MKNSYSLPFAVTLRRVFGALGLVLTIAPAAMATVTPAITAIDREGMAPFAVHVHALESNLGNDDPLTVRYEWNFGDSGSTYNTLTGWNAAHIYNKAGTYTVRLKVTDSAGKSTTASAKITVKGASRKAIHVASDGDDSNSGTADKPMRSFAKAMKKLRANGAVLLRSGDTFDVDKPTYINQQNVLIGSYGKGASPTLRWTAGDSANAIIGLGDAARDVVIDDVHFDSNTDHPNLQTVRAIHPNGVNLTVRNCGFDGVSYGMNCELTVEGLLAQKNVAGIVGAYFSWAQGSDHSYLGNTLIGSDSEHLIRFGGLDRSLIFDNDITNTTNSTIWAMLGSYTYISGNKLDAGRCVVGPNRAVGDPGDRFHWAVIEANDMRNQGFGVESGAEHVMIRNNIIQRDGDSCITIEGQLDSMNRTSEDVRVVNNTGINKDAFGRFIRVGSDSRNLLVANNLYMAPNLVTGDHETANAFVLDDNLDNARFFGNVWSNPKTMGWGKGLHYVFSHWSDEAGYKNKSEWSKYQQVGNDKYHSFKDGDLDGHFAPKFKAESNKAVPGVHEDFAGHARSLRSEVTAGAVDAS